MSMHCIRTKYLRGCMYLKNVLDDCKIG
jgi:hypothetical protein